MEGRWAAFAFVAAQEEVARGAFSGAFANLPKSHEAGRIAAEAAALYELLHPGTYYAYLNGDDAAEEALRIATERVFAALQNGDLRLEDGSLSDGWIEVFPGLTDEERGLFTLPGLIPPEMEEVQESFPIHDDPLPNHTGTDRPNDPTTNILADPVPGQIGPTILTIERTPKN